MDTTLRIAVIVGSIALIFLLLFANKHVVERYWLPAVADAELDGDEGEGRPPDSE